MIRTTQEAENERVAASRKSWAKYGSTSMAEIVRKARNMGWKEKTVQVRAEMIEEQEWFFIEPFEKDCNCPNILKYKDFFD